LSEIAAVTPEPKPARGPRFIGAGHVRPDPAWALKAHSHTFHEIIAPVRGKIHVGIRGQEVTAGSGELLFYRAGDAHSERSDRKDPVETYFVAFEHPALDGPMPVKLQDTRGRVPLMISWLGQEGHPANGLQRSAALGLLEAVVAEVRRLASEGEASPLVDRVRQFARAHLAERLTLDDLADRAGMDKFRFVRAFRRAAGRTPMKDLQLARVEFAKQLILTTDLPLKAIAPQAGLGDEYRLSRVFRRHLGLPPGALRNRAGSAKKPIPELP
jgi:AraC-like DNA-binding protein